ncbi:glycosyltransferase family 4 protein [Aquipuribacter sp. MA13-6]|uniref:glycosyltransferase family 4 protein n=1 Tax=unclassified Aquipuribacter TaxID=2635084 RepID=UPI003EEDA793
MRPGRLAVVVGNGVEGDSRVVRSALAGLDAGWQVLVLGRSSTGQVEHLELSGVPVTRVPVTTGASRSLEGRRRLRGRDRALPGRRPRLAHGAWRLLDPWVQDLELALAPELEGFRPDVVHAHDRHTLPLVGRSSAVLAAAGHRNAWVLDAHEDVSATAARGAGGLRGRARTAMVVGEQAEMVALADAVVTVSEPLAQKLQEDHRLPQRPTVVLNSPLPPPPGPDPHPGGVRAAAGVAADVPLLVYVGGCAPQRGVATLVDAVAASPPWHLALVASEDDRDATALLARAAAAGAGARVHRVAYVEPERVAAFLRSADLGVVPLLHRPNHEISLVTKYLEYLHAGLPVVVSDVREMARFTTDHGLGTVFPAGDAAGLAAAVTDALARGPALRAAVAASPAVAATAWPAQARTLASVYARVRPDA